MTDAPLCESLVTIQGIASQPALNGQVGYAISFDAERGRYAVALWGATSALALKPANLVAKDCGRTAEEVKTCNAETLLSIVKEREAMLHDKIAFAVGDRALKLHKELDLAVVIEQLTDSLYPAREPVAIVMFCLAISQLALSDDEFDFNKAKIEDSGPQQSLSDDAPMPLKDLAIAAGVVDKVMELLKHHKSSDVQSAALSLVQSMASGGQVLGATEERRAAVDRAGGTEAVIACLKLNAHRSAVQHVGFVALATILSGKDDHPPIELRRKKAAELGAIEIVIEGMRRHNSDSGRHDTAGKMAICMAGSTLHAGLMLLNTLVLDSEDRAEIAMRGNGAWLAMSAARRAIPQTDAFGYKVDLLGAIMKVIKSLSTVKEEYLSMMMSLPGPECFAMQEAVMEYTQKVAGSPKHVKNPI